MCAEKTVPGTVSCYELLPVFSEFLTARVMLMPVSREEALMLATIMTNRTRRSEWPLSLRTRAGVLVVLLSGLVAGCIVIPLRAEVKES